MCQWCLPDVVCKICILSIHSTQHLLAHYIYLLMPPFPGPFQLSTTLLNAMHGSAVGGLFMTPCLVIVSLNSASPAMGTQAAVHAI
jgi:hypothetical protein